MGWLRRIFFYLLRLWTGRLALTHLRRRGLLAYLRVLQAIRRSLIAAILFICCLQLMVLGLVGTMVTGILLANLDWPTKLWTLLGGFLTITIIPLIGFAVLLSERLWYKHSGAEGLYSRPSLRTDNSEEQPHTA